MVLKVKAYVTSIGESTTDLCVWALERNGFEVVLVYNETSSLADKLEYIYSKADDDFIRVDADVVVNSHCNPDMPGSNWWTQYLTFDWQKQDTTHGGVQLVRKEAIPTLREKIKLFKSAERPETEISRVKELYSPRRFETIPIIMGIHGYKALDVGRIKDVKTRRGHYDDYDWELAGRLEQL